MSEPDSTSSATVPSFDNDGDPLACAVGERYAGYEIRRFITNGGMCQIYEGWHEMMQRRVAVKVLKPQLRDNQLRSHRIAVEARALARVQHPNIVKILHADEDPRTGVFIVQELLEGKDLRRLIDNLNASGRRLALLQAATIILEVADAMIAFHLAGVFHRDLKPDNIFLHEVIVDGLKEVLVKILDLGIAKMQHGESKTTDRNLVVGTLLYIAPEVLMGEKASQQSDVYSLGLVLYELLSGVHAFAVAPNLSPEMRNAAIRGRILGGLYEPLDKRVPAIPASIARFVDRCLAMDPKDRPATMRDFAEGLRGTLRALTQERSDEHPIGTGPRNTPQHAAVAAAAAALRSSGHGSSLGDASQSGTPARVAVGGGTAPMGHAAVQLEVKPAPVVQPALARAPVHSGLPSFAVPLGASLNEWSLLLVEAPGAWRMMRIPVKIRELLTPMSRGTFEFGRETDVPIPGLPRLVIFEDHDGDLRLVGSAESKVQGDGLRSNFRPYATFGVEPYRFMMLPPSPTGLGILPDYTTITIGPDAPRLTSTLLVKGGHKSVTGRLFPLPPALGAIRVGGLVDLEIPLFRCVVPHAVTLRFSPREEAYRVDVHDPRATISGTRSDEGLLTPYGTLAVDGWVLSLQPRPRAPQPRDR
jgi:serine/threonine protein kinase